MKTYFSMMVLMALQSLLTQALTTAVNVFERLLSYQVLLLLDFAKTSWNCILLDTDGIKIFLNMQQRSSQVPQVPQVQGFLSFLPLIGKTLGSAYL